MDGLTALALAIYFVCYEKLRSLKGWNEWCEMYLSREISIIYNMYSRSMTYQSVAF